MKKIFTLLTVPFFALFTNSLQAQVKQDFSSNPSTITCFGNTGFTYSSNGGNSNSANQLTNVQGTSLLITPYIDIPAGAAISAWYKVSGNFTSGNGTKYSKIEIGILNSNGVYTVVNNSGNGQTFTSDASGTVSGTVITGGTYRIQVRVTTGNTSVTTNIDDITAASTSKYHYTIGGPCNQAPKANDDEFNAIKITDPVSGNVITNIAGGSDTDPNNSGAVNPDVLKINKPAAVVLDNPSQGTLVINANGDFTFTPNSTFGGGPVSFSYTITDNGYTPLTSTATVTINYPEAAPKLLPVKLISFQGTMTKERIQLQWSVAENEIADRFEVEKSTDGKNFTLATVVMSSSKSGNEVYQISEATAATPVMYRLKMFDRDGYINYSKIVAFQPATTAPAGNFKVTTATTDRVMATVTATASEEIQFAIYDLAGKRVQQQTMRLYNGQNTLTLSLNNSLKTGIYVAEVGSATHRQTAKFFIR